MVWLLVVNLLLGTGGVRGLKVYKDEEVKIYTRDEVVAEIK